MIQTTEMLKVFQEYRGDAIVVPGHAGSHWINISTRPRLDLSLSPPPSMGGQAAFACGLALALPQRKVVPFDSEGNLLMGLGILTTIAECAPKNLYHFVMDNECYATTGGQPVPNARDIAYDLIARGCGYKRTHAFERLEDLSAKLASILSEPGPVFVALKIVPEIDHRPIAEKGRWQTRTREQILQELRSELGIAA